MPIFTPRPPHLHLLRGLLRRGAVQRPERRRALRPLKRRPDWLRTARRLPERVGPRRALARRRDVHGCLWRHRGLPGVPERGPLLCGFRDEFLRREEPHARRAGWPGSTDVAPARLYRSY